MAEKQEKQEKQKIQTYQEKPEKTFYQDDKELILLNNETEVKLDEAIDNIDNFIKKYDGKGKSEEEKDELYAKSKDLWDEFKTIFKDTKFNFYLNRDEYNFLTTLLLQKIEYDVETIFFAIELTDMLGVMKKVKFKNDEEYVPFEVDATEITYIYHLIQKHKIKGLKKEAYLFANVLRKIGAISKLINYYDNKLKNKSKEIQDWVACFEEGVTKEKESTGNEDPAVETDKKSDKKDTNKKTKMDVKKTKQKSKTSDGKKNGDEEKTQ